MPNVYTHQDGAVLVYGDPVSEDDQLIALHRIDRAARECEADGLLEMRSAFLRCGVELIMARLDAARFRARQAFVEGA